MENLRGEGWNPYVFTDTKDAARLLKLKHIHVGLVFIDAAFGETARNEFLEVASQNPAAEWIAVLDPTAVNAVEHADFLRDVCFDFHTAPLELNRLGFALGHAFGAARLNEARQREFRQTAERRFGLVGSSGVMRRVLADLEKISRSDEPVILTGETGTGKELTARAIHSQSRRGAQPFVAVNCGAIPDSLVQSELFGHLKGAFTGAGENRIGYLEAAQGGTLFLDGIEDLSPLGQVTLLRFLQEKRITRLGGKDSLALDVRIIASAHPTLTANVTRGAVRQDLFYRLNVLQLDLPPLRERGTDAAEIAESVVERHNRERRKDAKRLDKNAIDRILNYPWPGNVRELVACVNRAAVLANGRLITVADLGLPSKTRYTGKSLREIKSNAVEQALIWALTETKNISSAARRLGVSRVTLYRLMEKHSIRAPGLHTGTHG